MSNPPNAVAAPPLPVLHVIQSVYPSTGGGGGAEGQVQTLARYFNTHGVPVMVLAPMVSWGPQKAADMVEDVPVVRISSPAVPLVAGAVMHAKLFFWLIRNRSRYSAIHVHIADSMAAVCAAVGSMLGKVVVVKLTGLRELDLGILSKQKDSPLQALKRVALRRATWLHAISGRIARQLVEFGFDRQRIIRMPNGLDLRRFMRSQQTRDQVRAELGLVDSDRVAVYAGRLEVVKGPDVLVDAWGKAFRGRPEFKLLMMGIGTLDETLPSRARELGISGQVKLLGPVPNVERVLQAADLFVLPSMNEGLSNALLEAMAMGLPVIGSRVSGTEDFVVSGQTGELFEPGDVDGLAAALTRFASLSAAEVEEQGRKGMLMVRSEASLERVAETLSRLYQGQTVTAREISEF